MNATQTRNQAAAAAEATAQAARNVVAEAARTGDRTAQAAVEQAPAVLRALRSGIDEMADRLPGAASAVQAGAAATSESIRTMPEPGLRLLAALSVGMGIGLYAAGAPRVATLVAITPAIVAAVVLSLDSPASKPSRH